jgi:hypothetical protein
MISTHGPLCLLFTHRIPPQELSKSYEKENKYSFWRMLMGFRRKTALLPLGEKKGIFLIPRL